jgi:hypothetical protein
LIAASVERGDAAGAHFFLPHVGQGTGVRDPLSGGLKNFWRQARQIQWRADRAQSVIVVCGI